MSGSRRIAPHVAAALGRAAGGEAPFLETRPLQPAAGARHVQAAVQRGRGGAAQAFHAPTTPRSASSAAASHFAALRAPAPRPGEPAAASHVARALQPAGMVTTYTDVKSPGAPPPPPRWPVYELRSGDDGCTIRDVKTGRTRPAGDLFGGFVRMSPGGPVYVSPRPAVGAPGDGHPTIASMTPEEATGRKALIAAGEIGILDGRIVGHNDKTGHYQTRRNLWQSGLPPEKYHPFTEDPKEWYRSK